MMVRGAPDFDPLDKDEIEQIRLLLARESAKRIGLLYFRNFADFITKAAALTGLGYMLWQGLIEKVVAESAK